MRQILYLMPLLFALACEQENRGRDRDAEYLSMTREEFESVQRDDPTGPGNIIFTKNEFDGMKLFMRNCNRCHPAGGKGKGPALNDKNIPDFAIHFQIRQGLGDMPAFKKDELSKEDVKKIILFVRILRGEQKSETAKVFTPGQKVSL